MENLKTILGVNGTALFISAININPYLQTISLILAIVYTGISIYKKI